MTDSLNESKQVVENSMKKMADLLNLNISAGHHEELQEKTFPQILKDYYDEFGDVGLSLFGFEYYRELSDDIIDNVVNEAGINENLSVEVKKGKALAPLVNARRNKTPSFEAVFKTKINNKGFSYNRIFFGAPGTGKSYTLDKERIQLFGEDNETDYERVTFHPDYSYANFVGTYKPVSYKDEEGQQAISYDYVPGPFMRAYVNALKNGRLAEPRPVLLIIEEINRANVAAVFGDIFQLLDRGEDGVSEYPIQASEDIKVYLAKELGGNPENFNKIRIPDNMFIWATMNSADQGVFPMDTAFKRRWDFIYLGIDENDDLIQGKYVYLSENKSQKVEWNKLRKAINHFLAKEKINEDKQLGPFFISKSLVVPNDSDEINREEFIRVFKNKVIMYLFEDAGKQKRARIFEGCSKNCVRYSDICKEFDERGICIFHHDIQQVANPVELNAIQADEEESSDGRSI